MNPPPALPRTSSGRRARRTIGALAAAAALLSFPLTTTAQAAVVENRLVGEVIPNLISPPDPVTEAALEALGVTNGARATVIFDVEDNTPGSDGPAGRQYTDAITRWTVTIGQFRAVFDPAEFNLVIVGNDQAPSGGPPVDVYSANGQFDVTDDLLSFANSVMILSEFGDGAIDDGGVGQNLKRFDSGSIAVGGVEGGISIVFFDGELPPLSSCDTRRIRAGAELCRAVLRCFSKFAKDGAPGDFEDCVDAAEAEFIQDYDEADGGGGVCTDPGSGAEAAQDLADDVDPLDTLVNQNANPASEADRTYRAKILKAASNAVEKALKLYAKDGKKPDADKLKKKLKANKKKLKKKVKKAGAQAEDAGIVADVSAKDVAKAVDDLVDSVNATTGNE